MPIRAVLRNARFSTSTRIGIGRIATARRAWYPQAQAETPKNNPARAAARAAPDCAHRCRNRKYKGRNCVPRTERCAGDETRFDENEKMAPAANEASGERPRLRASARTDSAERKNIPSRTTLRRMMGLLVARRSGKERIEVATIGSSRKSV